MHANSVDDPEFGDLAIDWDRISGNLRPAGSDDLAWADFIARNRARYGETYAELFDFVSTEYELLASRGYENVFFYEGLMNFDRPDIPVDTSVVRGLPDDGEDTTAAIAASASFQFFVGEGESVPVIPTGPDGIANTHAVVIGGGGNLPGAISDARAFSDLLINGANLPDGSTVTTLLDRHSRSVVTADEVLTALTNARNRLDGDDVLLVFNASHGSCVVPDSRFSNRKFFYGDPNSDRELSITTSLTPDQINVAIGDAPGTTVFIADTCFSGLITEDIDAEIKIASADFTPVPDGASLW